MSTLTFTPISPGQARALGRLGRMKNPPAKFVTAYDHGEGILIVVPASNKDRRRWDITKGGRIVKRPR